MNDLPPVYIAPRARAIAKGLVRSGRASEVVVLGTWLRAKARRGQESYFIDIAHGTHLLRGLSLTEASELSDGFAQAMVKRGA
jgi:hypothetical protein